MRLARVWEKAFCTDLRTDTQWVEIVWNRRPGLYEVSPGLSEASPGLWAVKDGWMGRQMDEWMDGLMDRWTDIRMYRFPLGPLPRLALTWLVVFMVVVGGGTEWFETKWNRYRSLPMSSGASERAQRSARALQSEQWVAKEWVSGASEQARGWEKGTVLYASIS